MRSRKSVTIGCLAYQTRRLKARASWARLPTGAAGAGVGCARSIGDGVSRGGANADSLVGIAALQGLGAHRARRREQDALAEAHIVVEQIDDRAFVFDTVGDQIDAEAAEQIGEIGRMNVGRDQADAIEQQGRPAP